MIPTASKRRTRRNSGICPAALLAGWMVLSSTSAWAQLPEDEVAGQLAPYTAQVRPLTEEAEHIRLPYNQSVLIETSRPSERIQALDPTIAFVQSISPTQILVTGTGTGTTQLITWSPEGQQQIFQIRVEVDLTALNEALASVDPLSQVEAVPLMGNVMLVGTASSTEMAERLLQIANLFVPQSEMSGTLVQNHMKIAGEQQVLLRCTVAEISRSAARQLGINGFLAGDNFRDGFIVNQLGGINPIDMGAGLGDVTSNLPFLTPGVPLQSTVPLSLGFPRVQMQVFIKALADNSLLRVLAEPNLVAISGETASFLVGGEFPIPVPQGVDQITIEFREFGARLNFTPVVRAGQRIRMHLAPEVSELDFSSAVTIGGFSVPGLTQRRVDTTIEVGDGQTFAIAGLLSDEVRGLASRVPGLGDVPVLGSLFRSVDYRRKITELVVLVTPEIVAPLNPNQVLPIPGEDLIEPNDFELYGLGLIEGQTPPATQARTCAATTPVVETKSEELSIQGPWGHATEND